MEMENVRRATCLTATKYRRNERGVDTKKSKNDVSLPMIIWFKIAIIS